MVTAVSIGLVVLGLVIAIGFFAAKAMCEIAAMKGHPQKRYFWWCFWLPAIGFLMVIALPDRKSAQAQSVPGLDELPEL